MFHVEKVIQTRKAILKIDPTNEKQVKGTPERVEPQLSNPKMTAKFN